MRFDSDTHTCLSRLVSQSIGCNLPAFAYRLPEEEVVYGGLCAPCELQKCNCEYSIPLNNKYIFAPFLPSSNALYLFKKKPILVGSLNLDNSNQYAENKQYIIDGINSDCVYNEYKSHVEQLVEAIKRGEIEKAVLSRTITVKRPNLSDATIFMRLCEKYPTAFVNWVHIPDVGRWIGATPEKLLDYNGEQIETMSLAGTRRAGTAGEWGEKEQKEQQIVTDYIYSIFRKFAPNAEQGERVTRRAGQVEHLCTPIRAKGKFDSERLCRLINALHPTPAVGGFPKAESLSLIQQVESYDRKYYGGYCGPISENSMRLFVNLRCMEMDDRYLRLYVGGGLTAQSQPESEWQETEAKAQTLLSVIQE